MVVVTEALVGVGFDLKMFHDHSIFELEAEVLLQGHEASLVGPLAFCHYSASCHSSEGPELQTPLFPPVEINLETSFQSTGVKGGILGTISY